MNILPKEPTLRPACLVTFFIAMALADNVLVKGSTFSDLALQKVPASALTYCLKCKPEAVERPIMRSTEANRSLSESQGLTYDISFNRLGLPDPRRSCLHRRPSPNYEQRVIHVIGMTMGRKMTRMASACILTCRTSRN